MILRYINDIYKRRQTDAFYSLVCYHKLRW